MPCCGIELRPVKKGVCGGSKVMVMMCDVVVMACVVAVVLVHMSFVTSCESEEQGIELLPCVNAECVSAVNNLCQDVDG